MKYLRVIMLMAAVLAACTIKKDRDARVEDVSDKSFEEFFNLFSRDSIFQFTRIKFPLEYRYYEEYNNDSLLVEKITASDWHYINFGEDSLAFKNEVDAYNIEIDRVNAKLVNYLRKGIDNGIFVTYRFKEVQGSWYLTEIVDRSN